MGSGPSASEGSLPAEPSAELSRVRREASSCHACDLWKHATQTVFGEGSSSAEVMLVGEQPGDREDLAGHPFVGPAGRVLSRALDAAGLTPDSVYVTNAVKHFKWEPRGKRRLHKRPHQAEVNACRPWLSAEVALIRPRAIVCLGATAARSLIGKEVRVTQVRGSALPSPLAPLVVATVHPSSILRAADEATREEAMRAFVADLRFVADRLRHARGASGVPGP